MARSTTRSEKKEMFAGDMRAAQERYNVGRYTIMKIAEESHAIIKVGRRVIYNFSKMDEYLNNISE